MNNSVIPKIIHCCWLSGGPKSELAEKCLASWRKFAPGWEVREWNLSNLSGLSSMPAFCRDAIAARKWAFAADWVRFAALQECGGVYFDYDFELVQSIDALPGGAWCAGQKLPNGRVAPEPAAIALEKGSLIARAMIDYYATAEFNDKVTVGEILERIRDRGSGIRVLDPEVMSPIDNEGRMHRTNRTVGIHWYAMSWASPGRKAIQWMSWHGMQPLINFLLRIKRAFVRR